jgi:hypothetical protein
VAVPWFVTVIYSETCHENKHKKHCTNEASVQRVVIQEAETRLHSLFGFLLFLSQGWVSWRWKSDDLSVTMYYSLDGRI